MARTLVGPLALALLTAAALTAHAADAGKGKKPVGTWERKVGDSVIKFDIKADTFQMKLTANGATIEVDAAYGVTKDGTLFGIVTKVKTEGTNDGPSEGHLFSFGLDLAKDTLTIKDLKGTDNAEAKQLVEGEYKKVK